MVGVSASLNGQLERVTEERFSNRAAGGQTMVGLESGAQRAFLEDEASHHDGAEWVSQTCRRGVGYRRDPNIRLPGVAQWRSREVACHQSRGPSKQ